MDLFAVSVVLQNPQPTTGPVEQHHLLRSVEAVSEDEAQGKVLRELRESRPHWFVNSILVGKYYEED